MNNANANQIASSLALAAAATLNLARDGVSVLAAFTNGRRAVLRVTHMPDGTMSVMKSVVPTRSGGHVVTHAATYQGCQIEHVYERAAVQDQPRRPVLEVISNG